LVGEGDGSLAQLSRRFFQTQCDDFARIFLGIRRPAHIAWQEGCISSRRTTHKAIVIGPKKRPARSPRKQMSGTSHVVGARKAQHRVTQSEPEVRRGPIYYMREKSAWPPASLDHHSLWTILRLAQRRLSPPRWTPLTHVTVWPKRFSLPHRPVTFRPSPPRAIASTKSRTSTLRMSLSMCSKLIEQL
jgi:hypothetical protein